MIANKGAAAATVDDISADDRTLQKKRTGGLLRYGPCGFSGRKAEAHRSTTSS